MDPILITLSLATAYIMYRILTRPDPTEQHVVKELKQVLNEPQYRVKGKYE